MNLNRFYPEREGGKPRLIRRKCDYWVRHFAIHLSGLHLGWVVQRHNQLRPPQKKITG